MDKKVSLKEIAEMCGVSVATVSRVINQNGRFSKETDKKVREVIEQYNYRPNQIAKGLRTNKIDTIGIIVPDITNEFFAMLILALQKRLFQENYSCIIFNTNESKEIERRCVASMMALNISGIVSVNGRLELSKMLQSDMPVVYIDRQPEEISNRRNAMFLSSDHEYGAYLAGRELARCGCRRVACITALWEASTTQVRNTGFARACREFGMELPQELIFSPAEVSRQSGYEIVSKMLDGGAEFDGIFCQTDWLAIGALAALLDHGIRVPDQVQLVGFDDTRASQIAQIPLTTVHQPSSELGVQTADAILRMANGYVPEGAMKKLPVTLIRRATTRPREGER